MCVRVFNIGYPTLLFSIFFIDPRSLSRTEPGAHQLDRLAGQQAPEISPFPHLGARVTGVQH